MQHLKYERQYFQPSKIPKPHVWKIWVNYGRGHWAQTSSAFSLLSCAACRLSSTDLSFASFSWILLSTVIHHRLSNVKYVKQGISSLFTIVRFYFIFRHCKNPTHLTNTNNTAVTPTGTKISYLLCSSSTIDSEDACDYRKKLINTEYSENITTPFLDLRPTHLFCYL